MSKYEKQNFVRGQILTAAQLNHIENGIENVLPTVEAGEAKQLVTDTEGNLLWEKKTLDYTYEYENLFDEIELTGEDQIRNFIPLRFVEEIAPLKIVINGTEYDATFSLRTNGIYYIKETVGGITLDFLFAGNPAQVVGYPVPTIIDLDNVTGTLAIKILTKKYQKIDSNYLPLPAVYGTGENSINLNNNPTSEASNTFDACANNGKASGSFSFAANYGFATKRYAFAHGNSTHANGAGSHAEGYCTIAAGMFQHAEGQYNIEDTENKYAHIVGNGYYDSDNSQALRSNAYTLDWSGNGWFAGTVEGTGVIVKSSTEGSNKRFKLTVDDSGTISAVEVTE